MTFLQSARTRAIARSFFSFAATCGLVFLTGSCGGDATGSLAATVTSIQMIATPTNPRVGETTILGAIPAGAGGVAISGIACVMASGSPAVLAVTPDGGGWRGLGVTVGVAVVTATCAGVANTVTITVRPTQVALTVNKIGAGAGSVFITPPGGTYDMGETVVITASALAGSTFTGWGGACPAGVDPTCRLTLTASQSVTARFETLPPGKIIGLAGNLAFGNVTIGQRASTVMTVTNGGASTLTITGMTAPAGGAYTASWTSGAIPAGGSQLVTVFFTPTAAQSYSGTLTVNGDQTSGVNTLPISGTGVGATTPGSSKYDGTYDFFFKHPAPGGVTQSVSVARFFIIRNGVVSSSDGTLAGVVDGFGKVTFTGPCPINSSVGDWVGSMNASALAGSNFGEGTYTCRMAIGGSSNTWQANQSR